MVWSRLISLCLASHSVLRQALPACAPRLELSVASEIDNNFMISSLQPPVPVTPTPTGARLICDNMDMDGPSVVDGMGRRGRTEVTVCASVAYAWPLCACPVQECDGARHLVVIIGTLARPHGLGCLKSNCAQPLSRDCVSRLISRHSADSSGMWRSLDFHAM